jgi:hypothetical protein
MTGPDDDEAILDEYCKLADDAFTESCKRDRGAVWTLASDESEGLALLYGLTPGQRSELVARHTEDILIEETKERFSIYEHIGGGVGMFSAPRLDRLRQRERAWIYKKFTSLIYPAGMEADAAGSPQSELPSRKRYAEGIAHAVAAMEKELERLGTKGCAAPEKAREAAGPGPPGESATAPEIHGDLPTVGTRLASGAKKRKPARSAKPAETTPATPTPSPPRKTKQRADPNPSILFTGMTQSKVNAAQALGCCTKSIERMAKKNSLSGSAPGPLRATSAARLGRFWTSERPRKNRATNRDKPRQNGLKTAIT